ncbi:hypothetical protein B0H10DRAFT_2430620 [Mycena sp. CBHHK59/15]|nr:hypothetical protein B0H10DRAFT_2430620 [Mycena sp. CBHHK59/15]
MTISHNLSTPLAVLVGITGLQGGSVARDLIESEKPYRLCGLKREVTKPAAQAFAKQGVEVVGVSLTVDDAANVSKAFAGADIAFIVTNFNEHLDKQRETAEGKLLRRFWGKYPRVVFSDTKAEITAYAKQSGVPLSVVQAGFYATNILEGSHGLKKQPDGSYVLGLPVAASTTVPVIYVAHDYGLYVRAAIEVPSHVSGKKIRYSAMDREAFIDMTQMPDFGPIFADMFQAIEEHGHESLNPSLRYCGGKEVTDENLLARKPRS